MLYTRLDFSLISQQKNLSGNSLKFVWYALNSFSMVGVPVQFFSQIDYFSMTNTHIFL